MSEHIQVEKQDYTLVVRINRPERKNALTHAMYNSLTDAIATAEADKGVRCLLITGSPDCFTAGNDLTDFSKGLSDDFKNTPVGQFLFALTSATKPIVAAVNGPAIGIGTTMLLHCDLVFAGNNTRFQMPFAALGLCPEGGSSLLLPTWLGRVRASELLMLGDAFSAEKADQLGLINYVCEPQDTEKSALESCQRISAKPPASIRATKALLNRPSADQLKASMLAEGDVFAKRLRSPEAAEAFKAFSEKRQPDFSQFS